jgi:hypothetical protein
VSDVFFSAESLSAECAFILRQWENERIKRAYFTYLAEAQRFSETAFASGRRRATPIRSSFREMSSLGYAECRVEHDRPGSWRKIGPIPLKTRSDDAGTFQLHGSSIIGATQLEEPNGKRRGD